MMRQYKTYTGNFLPYSLQWPNPSKRELGVIISSALGYSWNHNMTPAKSLPIYEIHMSHATNLSISIILASIITRNATYVFCQVQSMNAGIAENSWWTSSRHHSRDCCNWHHPTREKFILATRVGCSWLLRWTTMWFHSIISTRTRW